MKSVHVQRIVYMSLLRVARCEIKIWDSTASWWINPKQFGGYGGVLVLRVFTGGAGGRNGSSAPLSWGAHRITPNQWQKIERARGGLA